MENIKVSVVTVVRNDCANIEKTMRSVLEQTYKNVQYIIKDGLSKDGTQTIVKSVREQYPNRSVELISCEDTGIYDAMNQAVSYCEGEWVVFINSGDSLATMDILFDIFGQNKEYKNDGVLYGDAVVRDESGDALWKANLDKIKEKMPFCHQSCFVRKSYLLKYPFDCNFKIAADYNQMLDLYNNNVSFRKINSTVAIFELDGVSSTKFISRFKERNLTISNHGIRNKGKILLLLEYLMECVKTVSVKVIPDKILVALKKWYKVNIRHYEVS